MAVTILAVDTREVAEERQGVGEWQRRDRKRGRR